MSMKIWIGSYLSIADIIMCILNLTNHVSLCHWTNAIFIAVCLINHILLYKL